MINRNIAARAGEVAGTDLYVDSLHLMTASLANAGFGFAFWTVAARLYSTETVGLTAAAVSAVTLLALLSVPGLDFALIRFLPAASKPDTFINSSLTISVALSAGISLTFMAIVAVRSPVGVEYRSLFVAIEIVLATILVAASALLGSVYVVRGRASLVLAHAAIFGAARVLLAYVLANHPSVSGLFGGWVLGLLIPVVLGLILFLPRVEGKHYRLRPALEGESLTRMMRFAFANYLGVVLWSAPQLLLPLLIVNLVNPIANAFFAVAVNIVGLLIMIPQAISLSLFAQGAREQSGLLEHSLRSARFALYLLVPGIAGILILGDKVLLLFGSAYSDGSTHLLWILALATFPMTVNLMFFAIRRVQQRMREIVAAAAWNLIVTLASSAFLVQRMGVVGAGLGWMLGQSSTAAGILIYGLARGNDEFRLGKRSTSIQP